MNTITVTLSNPGGVLDTRRIEVPQGVHEDEDITAAVLAMIQEAGSLSVGDTIAIRAEG